MNQNQLMQGNYAPSKPCECAKKHLADLTINELLAFADTIRELLAREKQLTLRDKQAIGEQTEALKSKFDNSSAEEQQYLRNVYGNYWGQISQHQANFRQHPLINFGRSHDAQENQPQSPQ